MSFTADRDMMPDPEAFAAALRGSFTALRDTVQPPLVPAVQPGSTDTPAMAPAASEGA